MHVVWPTSKDGASKGIVGASRRVQVFIRNLVTEVSIGVYPCEREQRQRMRIDVAVEVHYPDIPQGLEDVLDYGEIRRRIIGLANAEHVELQETFCEGIVALCLNFPHVSAVRVRVAKLDAFPDCEAVGCEVEVGTQSRGEAAMFRCFEN
jgi:dihydroneopterin aldolase